MNIPPLHRPTTPPLHHPTTPYLNKKSQDRRYIYTISARVHVGSIKMWRVNLFAKQSTIQLFNPIAITSIANCLCWYVRDLILSTGQHMIYLILFVVIFLIEYQANNKNLHKTCAFEARLTMALRSTGSKPVEDWTFSGFFWPISSVAALLRRSVHYFLSTTGENTWNLFHLFENADIVLHSRVICTLLCAVDNNSELTKFSANPRFIFANKIIGAFIMVANTAPWIDLWNWAWKTQNNKPRISPNKYYDPYIVGNSTFALIARKSFSG